jgi:hypothetical protein
MSSCELQVRQLLDTAGYGNIDLDELTLEQFGSLCFHLGQEPELGELPLQS